MTVLDDPPVEASPRPVARSAAGRPNGSWRVAARLARREVRRRQWRTALVAALVAVPVAAMAVASIAATTIADGPAEQFARRAGRADIIVEPGSLTVEDASLEDALPAGATWLRSVEAYVPLRTDTGVVEGVTLIDIDLRLPIADGIVEIQQGRAPAPGEVLLSADVADRFGVAVGDELELDRPTGTWTVSGIGRRREFHDERLLVMPDFPVGQLQPDYHATGVRIDLPDGSATAVMQVARQLQEEVAGGAFLSTPYTVDVSAGEVGADSLAWGWVAGTIALAATGVVIAAAFATSARRQLTTIGQLAANGASPRLVRRTLALQGSWSGMIGGVVGLGLALIASITIVAPISEALTQRDVGPIAVDVRHLAVILITAVIVATMAAALPARSAARIPVLAALAGRRPLGVVPRRLVPIGLGLFLGGLALLLASATAAEGDAAGNLVAAVAVVGGLAVLAGTCCVTPLAVDALRRLPVRGDLRLATRSLARQRSRSAAVVTAIATVGALSIAGAAIASGVAAEELDAVDETPNLPDDAVLIRSGYDDWEAGPVDAAPVPIPPGVRAEIDAVVPEATVRPLRGVAPEAILPAGWPQMYGPSSIVLADEAALDLIGLSDRDRAALDRVGVLAMFDFSGEGGFPGGFPGEVGPGEPPRLLVPAAGGNDAVPAALRQDVPASWGGHVQYLVTPAKVAELGWIAVDAGLIVWNGSALTDVQRGAFEDVNRGQFGPSPWLADADVPLSSFWVEVQYRDGTPDISPAAMQGAIVALAVLLTLAVVAIGLALAASEGRDERDVVVAVGGSPATMRRLAAGQALTLAAVGGVLAVPVGYLPILAVDRAIDADVADFPWLTALGVVVVVPLLAAGAALATSTIAQRVRPVRMSTLTVD